MPQLRPVCSLALSAATWAAAAAALGALACPEGVRAQEAGGPSASTSVYVRTDTDKTTVITPRVRLGATVAEQTRLDLIYSVDVWTSASIDIRTAASKRVTEQRDEINVVLARDFTDLNLAGSYRYSTEADYESHGGSLDLGYDFADNNATFALAVRAYFDQVGRAGDPNFGDHPVSTLNARASFTQVLDAATFVQLIYEVSKAQGYLSSPYRWVRIASDQGIVPSTCQGPTVALCLIEENPDNRLRHAIAVYARRALGGSLSIGGSYRFYTDDWAIVSHTAEVDGSWIPDAGWLLALAYRFYSQSEAAHYQPFYLAPVPAHFTSDKELTAFSAHRVSLELSHVFEHDGEGPELKAVLLAAPSYFSYSNFLPLDQILAFELTLALEVLL